MKTNLHLKHFTTTSLRFLYTFFACLSDKKKKGKMTFNVIKRQVKKDENTGIWIKQLKKKHVWAGNLMKECLLWEMCCGFNGLSQCHSFRAKQIWYVSKPGVPGENHLTTPSRKLSFPRMWTERGLDIQWWGI